MSQGAPQHRSNFEDTSRAVDLLAQFFVSQGLTYDAVNNNALQSFIKELRPDFEIPTSQTLKTSTKLLQSQWAIAYIGVTEVSVTFDVVGGPNEDDDKFLTFSAHFFAAPEDLLRQNVVYFRRLDSFQIDGRTVINTLIRAIRNDFHPNCHIKNLVVPSREICQQFNLSGVSISNNFICFHYFIGLFLEDVLQIEEFAKALSLVRKFVRMIKHDPVLLEKFNKMQLTYNATVEVPTLPKNDWQSIAEFLASFVSSYEMLMRFAGRFQLRIRISDVIFQQISYLHKILEKCSMYTKQLSTPQSSISQVIPAIVGLKNFIYQLSTGYTFEGVIKRMFANVFQNIMSGELRLQYDMATLLDPRYGYSDELYSEVVWLDIERKLIKSHSEDNSPERRMLIPQVRFYRKAIWETRPGESENPLIWWSARENELSQLARSFFSCSPVVVDGEHFFGARGKLSYPCQKLNEKDKELDNYLSATGYQQSFRGKGSESPEVIDVPEIPVVPDLSFPLMAPYKRGPEDCELVFETKEPDEVHFAGFDPGAGSSSSANSSRSQSLAQNQYPFLKSHAAPKRRHCNLCGQLEVGTRTRAVQPDSERLLLCLGALYQEDMNTDEVQTLYERKRMTVCRKHFPVTCNTIVTHLQATNYRILSKLPHFQFNSIVKDIENVFKTKMENDEVQNMITLFTAKYHDFSEERDDLRCDKQPTDDEEVVVVEQKEQKPSDIGLIHARVKSEPVLAPKKKRIEEPEVVTVE